MQGGPGDFCSSSRRPRSVSPTPRQPVCSISEMRRAAGAKGRRTTLVTMRDSRRFCWCSCGLSCEALVSHGKETRCKAGPGFCFSP